MKPLTPQRLTLLTLFLVTLLSGCKKENSEPQLPPYTQEGKNIFACKINGEIYVSEGVLPKNRLNSRGIDNNYLVWGEDTIVTINAKEEEPKEGKFYIEFIYTSTKDKLELNPKHNSFANIYLPVDNYIFAESRFTTTENDTGWVKVNYFQNKIIAGTFEFTAIDDRGEIIHVTDGRFDLSTK